MATKSKANAVKAVQKHEKRLHPGQPLTKMAKGGKTKQGKR